MSPKPESAEITVRVIPRSSKNKIEAAPDGTVKLWVTAPPVDGEANAAVVDLLAKALSLKRGNISIVSGESSRNKRIRVENISPQELQEKLRDV